MLDDAAAAGTQRRANRDLAQPVHRAHQQQVGHVDAGHQQHQHDRSEHHVHGGRGRFTNEALGETFDRDLEILVGLRVTLRQLRGDHAEFTARLRAAHTRTQPAEDVHGRERDIDRIG